MLFACNYSLAQNFHQLPYSQASTLGKSEYLLIDKESGDTINAAAFTLKKDCCPCKYELQLNNYFRSREVQPLVFEGVDSVVIRKAEVIDQETLDIKFTQSTSIYNLYQKSDTILNLELFAEHGTSIRIFTIEQNGYADLVNPYDVVSEKRFNFFYFISIGVLLILALLNSINFLITRRDELLFYTFYIISILLFIIAPAILDFFGVQGHTMQHKSLLRIVRVVTQPLSYLFYYLFIIKFLKAEKYYPLLYKMLRLGAWVSGITILVLIPSIIADQIFISQVTFTVYRLALAVASLFMIVYTFIKARDIYAHIIVLSGVFLVVGSLMAWYHTIHTSTLLGVPPMGWFLLAIMLELILFSSGLSLQSKAIENEKESISNKLLLTEKELVRNEKQKAHQLIRIIDEKSKEIESEVEMRIKNEFLLKVKQLEQEALLTQMNPHFLFNSLNNLKSYIVKNNEQEASQYLNRLSSFFRKILNTARNKQISLEDELNFIAQYVQLENYRLTNKIRFTKTMSEAVDHSVTYIPTMLIQPLIENSIIHGFVSSTRQKEINIHLDCINDCLTILVSDNGVGLKPSNIQFNPTKTSLSTQINRERLNLIYGEKAKLEIKNRVINGKVVGVDASIILPIS